jgi:transcription antitermination factor NusG
MVIERIEPHPRWYAVQTQPNREFLAAGALVSVEGVETYLPTLRVQPVNPRARTELPFFPGYLFVRADLVQVGRSALQWRPGITRLVGLDSEPTPIPDRVVDEIQSRVRAAQAKDPLGLGEGAYLKPGDSVRIQSGPLRGYEGMFDTRLGGQTRARILVDFMGRELKTECDVRALEKVERGDSTQRRKGGKGNGVCA